MPDLYSGDIQMREEQEALADSLVEPIEVTYEGPEEQDAEPGEEVDTRLAGEREQAVEMWDQLEGEQNEEAEWAQKATEMMDAQDAEAQEGEQPEETGLQPDEAIEHYELNDKESAEDLTTALASAMEANPDDLNSAALGHTLAKTTLNVAQIFDSLGGDASKVQPITPESAQHFTESFLSSFGIDPRFAADPQFVDCQRLAETVFGATWNLLRTYEASGRSTDITRLNDVPMAVNFYQNLVASFGGDPARVDQDTALRVVDAAAQHILGTLGKLQNAKPIARPSARASRQRAERGNFKTNNDLFSPDVLKDVHQEMWGFQRQEAE